MRPLAPLALLVLAASCAGSGVAKVALIGDSITDLARQPLQQALAGNGTIEIVGKFGARSDEVLAEVEVIAASKPDVVIINIGTNDAIQQVPVAQTEASIQTMLDLLDGVGCRFLVQINEGITDTATGEPRQAEARAINDRLAAIGRSRGAEIIEWNRIVADNGGVSALTIDTVHLTDKGVVRLGEAYRQAVERC